MGVAEKQSDPEAGKSANYPPAVGRDAVAGPAAKGYQPAAAPPPAFAAGAPVSSGADAQALPVEGCRCNEGWILFGLGFIFPICWIICMFMPLCLNNRNNRRAAIGSGVCFSAYFTLVLIFAVIVPASMHWYNDDKTKPLVGMIQGNQPLP